MCFAACQQPSREWFEAAYYNDVASLQAIRAYS